MIRALIFDCFGVLYGDNIDHLYNLVGQMHHDELHDLVQLIDRGHCSEAEFIAAVARLAQLPEETISHVTHQPHVRNEPLIIRVKMLHTQYKTGLITNVSAALIETILPKAEREQLFDVSVISGQEGIIKPDPAIYELAAARLGLETTECLFIDDRESNVDGARRVGMQALLFSTNQQFERDLEKALSA